jgi:hypothetical protein
VEPCLFSPTRFLCLWLAGMRKRRRCGKRFGHFRAEDWGGYGRCARCDTPLI